MEWRLFKEGTTAYVSTAEFHKDRERASHVNEPVHRARLDLALDCVRAAAHWYGEPTLSDLGAGDGGFLSMVAPYVGRAWGYDLCPANVAGAEERGVDVRFADFTTDDVDFGTIVVMTEVLEHMTDPHAMLRRLWTRGVRVVVASSPYMETDISHDACHAWAWDESGYRNMFERSGWSVARQETVPYFQVVLARR